MSLPTFKFTNFGAPTNNESVNSGLSVSSKLQKSGIISTIKEKAQETFKDLKMPELSLETNNSDISQETADNDSSIFSFWNLVKFIIIVAILWFMWSSLSSNTDFSLGMGEFGSKIKSVLKTMEDKGREVVSRFTDSSGSGSTNQGTKTSNNGDSDSDSDSDDGNDNDNGNDNGNNANFKKRSSRQGSHATGTYRPPVPPDATNSSDKKPGFLTDDTKYTFLDKAQRDYSGPSPSADDSTSVTQKHQSGKGGYCYIGEDRGFRSCVQVDASDKCMSGQVYSRHDICIDPTLRE